MRQTFTLTGSLMLPGHVRRGVRGAKVIVNPLTTDVQFATGNCVIEFGEKPSDRGQPTGQHFDRK